MLQVRQVLPASAIACSRGPPPKNAIASAMHFPAFSLKTILESVQESRRKDEKKAQVDDASATTASPPDAAADDEDYIDDDADDGDDDLRLRDGSSVPLLRRSVDGVVVSRRPSIGTRSASTCS